MIDFFRKTFPAELSFYLGCPHWNHKNICAGTSDWGDRSGCRIFHTLDDMNAEITKSILDNVPPDGMLFILGDIIFGDKAKLKDFLGPLRPRTLVNVFGNHCLWMRGKSEVIDQFDWTGDYLEIFVRRKNGSKKLCCLFHYPMKVWNESHKGSYAITSHSHGSLPYAETELGLDVGWDVFKKPMSFNEIDAILSKRNNVPRDHHGPHTN